jgi:chemotaxis response regulator CheB
LIAIKRRGGVSLVQHPGEARFETMPCNAIAEDDVDAMLTIDEFAVVLPALARGDAIDAPRPIATP